MPANLRERTSKSPREAEVREGSSITAYNVMPANLLERTSKSPREAEVQEGFSITALNVMPTNLLERTSKSPREARGQVEFSSNTILATRTGLPAEVSDGPSSTFKATDRDVDRARNAGRSQEENIPCGSNYLFSAIKLQKKSVARDSPHKDSVHDTVIAGRNYLSSVTLLPKDICKERQESNKSRLERPSPIFRETSCYVDNG
jgi:hypothetical protein